MLTPRAIFAIAACGNKIYVIGGTEENTTNGLTENLCNFGLDRKLADGEQVYYFATPRGLEFLDTYWKMTGFFEIFGDKHP